MHRGFAKLYRKFLEWEWYDDMPCKVLYIHCLLKANHKEKEYRGVPVHRGMFLTSYATLSKQTGLTVKQVRVAASKLEGKYLASKRTNKGQAVSVVDFERYNGSDDREGTHEGTQRARRGHAEGTQRATTKNAKECLKNEKNEKEHTPKPPKGADVRFESFWNAYDHKIGKGAAVRAFKKAIKAGLPEPDTLVTIIGVQKAQRAKLKVSGVFVPEWPNPTTWLNGERWLDEIKAPAGSQTMDQHANEWLALAED